MLDTSVEGTQASGKRASTAARRSGYVAAIVINSILLLVAHNLLSWGWPAFLTEDFAGLIPLINLSLGATILINFAYLNYDPDWFKSSTQIGLGSISMVLAVRTFQLFPFDFTGYEFNWEPIARVMIVVSMVGIGIGLIVELVKLVSLAARSQQ